MISSWWLLVALFVVFTAFSASVGLAWLTAYNAFCLGVYVMIALKHQGVR